MHRVAVLSLLSILFSCSSLAKGNGNLQFITNKGQVTDQYHQPRTDIDAKIEQGGVTLFVGSGHLHYQWVKSPSLALPHGERTNNIPLSPLEGGNRRAGEGQAISIYRMDVVLVGANKNAEVIFEEPTGYTEHYYKEYTPEEGAHAKGYQKVTYKDIWPGIDWVLYTTSPNPPESSSGQAPQGGELSLSPWGRAGEGPHLKYDFIVHPHGNVNDIQLRYEGATALSIDDGMLTASTPFGSITEAAPYSYEAATKQMVSSAYQLSGNILRFAVAEHEGTLVIDPKLDWATYYGGSKGAIGSSTATDLFGHVYLMGATVSTNNIATTGTHKTTFNANAKDLYVVKFNTDGQRIWGTYYGGEGDEYDGNIACDSKGNIYICGGTFSDSGIATQGAFKTSHYGNISQSYTPEDVFFAKLDSSGQRVWGTYYGAGELDDYICLTVDRIDDIIIAGHTQSDSFMTTQGTYMDTFKASSCPSYIAKFNGNGQRIWGTYFGDYSDSCNAIIKTIAIDDSNNIYVAGETRIITKSALSTTGAHQVTKGSKNDGFLAKISSNGQQKIWATYYGGSNFDEVNGVACDDSGNVYIAGFTNSSNNIVSTGAYQTSFTNSWETFLTKFNRDGTRLWGTYYGGNNHESAAGLSISPRGNIYMNGSTNSTNNIALNSLHQNSFAGNVDIFLSEWTPAGVLSKATYFGGSALERYAATHGVGEAAHCNPACSYNERVYIIGNTASGSGIATTGAHQTSLGGSSNSDAFLACFYMDVLPYIEEPFTDTVWCPGDTVPVPYGVTAQFFPTNTFTIQLSDSNGSFANPVTIGSRADSTADTITCVVPTNITPATGYHIRITSDTFSRVSAANYFEISVAMPPQGFSNTTATPVCTRDTLHLTGASTSSGINWSWSGPNSFASSQKDTFIANAQLSDSGRYILTATLNSTGCSLSDTVDVEMRPTPDTPTAGSNSPVCETFALNLTTSTTTNGVSWSWSGPGSYNSTTQNPTVTSSASSTHAGNYIAMATLNGCSSTDTVTVVVLPKPAKPTAGATNSPLCQFQDLQLTASNITGASYNWYGPSLFTATTQNPTRYSMTFADSGYYYVYATINGCASDTDSVYIKVNTDPVVNIFPSPGTTICKGEEVTFTAVPTNAGTATYGWSVNYINTGTTGTVYKTSTLNNGDVVRCEMVSTGTCATAYTDTSNGITMTVNDVKVPSVAISANPNTSLYPDEPVTFTASPTNGGNNPTYQWLRNGSPISGAQSAVWGANANFLNDGDDICVVLFSDHVCPEPDTALSNCIKVDIRLSVATIAGNSNINIYPNPVTNELHIEGIDNGTVIELYDVVGKKIHHATTSNNKYSINMSSYSAGNYVLRITQENGTAQRIKVIKE